MTYLKYHFIILLDMGFLVMTYMNIINYLNFSGFVTLNDKMCPHFVQISASIVEPPVKKVLCFVLLAGSMLDDNLPFPISLHPYIGHYLLLSIKFFSYF